MPNEIINTVRHFWAYFKNWTLCHCHGTGQNSSNDPLRRQWSSVTGALANVYYHV